MANEIQDEINELLGELETSENGGEENETQKQGTENAVGAAESGQDGEQDQETQPEAETEPSRGNEEQQEEADEVKQRKTDQEQSESEVEREETPEEENQRLRAELDRVSGEVQKQPAESQQSESGESETSETGDFDPLMGFEFDSLMEDQKQFSEWAKKLYEQAKSKAHEEMLQNLPNTVNQYIEQQLSVREQANRFYQENPELANYKQYVARLANDVAAEMSDKSWEEVLQETGKRAYKNLNLQKQAQQKESDETNSQEQVKNPGLAKGTKRQAGSKKGQSPKNADQRSETEKQIDQLLEFE